VRPQCRYGAAQLGGLRGQEVSLVGRGLYPGEAIAADLLSGSITDFGGSVGLRECHRAAPYFDLLGRQRLLHVVETNNGRRAGRP